MKKSNADNRSDALCRYVVLLSPNLLRAYVLDMIDMAAPQEVDKLVVALHAQNAVPAKEA